MLQVAGAPTFYKTDVATLVVSAAGHGRYREIGKALRDAPEGAMIRVLPGVYREALTIDKAVEIAGDGPAGEIVIESDSAECLYSTASGAIVRCLTLRCTAGRKGLPVFGVLIERGDLLLEDCDIASDSGAPCLAVRGQADPTVRHSRIHDGVQCGVIVYEGGRGTFEACDIFANDLAAMEVRQGGNPVVRQCRISGGMSVFEKGRGTFEDCEVSGGALNGLEVRNGGAPVVRRCEIHGGAGAGLFVSAEGGGCFENCNIYDNGLSGVEIKEGGDAVLRRSKIHHNGTAGVMVWQQGAASFEDCELWGHRGRNFDIEEGCAVRRSNVVER